MSLPYLFVIYIETIFYSFIFFLILIYDTLSCKLPSLTILFFLYLHAVLLIQFKYFWWRNSKNLLIFIHSLFSHTSFDYNLFLFSYKKTLMHFRKLLESYSRTDEWHKGANFFKFLLYIYIFIYLYIIYIKFNYI